MFNHSSLVSVLESPNSRAFKFFERTPDIVQKVFKKYNIPLKNPDMIYFTEMIDSIPIFFY